MDLSRTWLLPLAWWCAAVLPGLTLAVVFPDQVRAADGWVVPVWFFTYALQVVVFIVASRTLRRGLALTLMWIAVVVVPLGVDWTSSNVWAEVAFVLVAVAVALGLFSDRSRSAAIARERAARAAASAPLPPPVRRGAWRFTSWKGRAGGADAVRSRGAGARSSYAPYERGSADSAPPE